MTDKERLEEMNKLKNIINSLDDSADADDFHKFVDTCQINYEEGVFNEILRFMQSQAERVQELEETVEDYKTVNKELHLRGRKVRKQNKRYREVINNINEKSILYGVNEQVCESIKEAIKLLESENK